MCFPVPIDCVCALLSMLFHRAYLLVSVLSDHRVLYDVSFCCGYQYYLSLCSGYVAISLSALSLPSIASASICILKLLIAFSAV